MTAASQTRSSRSAPPAPLTCSRERANAVLAILALLQKASNSPVPAALNSALDTSNQKIDSSDNLSSENA